MRPAETTQPTSKRADTCARRIERVFAAKLTFAPGPGVEADTGYETAPINMH